MVLIYSEWSSMLKQVFENFIIMLLRRVFKLNNLFNLSQHFQVLVFNNLSYHFIHSGGRNFVSVFPHTHTHAYDLMYMAGVRKPPKAGLILVPLHCLSFIISFFSLPCNTLYRPPSTSKWQTPRTVALCVSMASTVATSCGAFMYCSSKRRWRCPLRLVTPCSTSMQTMGEVMSLTVSSVFTPRSNVVGLLSREDSLHVTK